MNTLAMPRRDAERDRVEIFFAMGTARRYCSRLAHRSRTRLKHPFPASAHKFATPVNPFPSGFLARFRNRELARDP